MDGKIDQTRFQRETHAIMLELRYSNPKHLEQIEEAQRSKMQKQGREEEFVGIKARVDRTLLALLSRTYPGINTPEKLDAHIQALRKDLLNPTEVWATTLLPTIR